MITGKNSTKVKACLLDDGFHLNAIGAACLDRVFENNLKVLSNFFYIQISYSFCTLSTLIIPLLNL